jgi:prepilin-type N-terminal cleavage/methylation domain-containing protein
MNFRTRRGFTLMETLVVVAIIGVILLFAIPMLYRMLQSYYVKTAANQFAIQVRMARNLSVSQKTNYQIVINSQTHGTNPNIYQVQFAPGGTYQDVPNVDTRIPSAVQIPNTAIFSAGQAKLIFDPRGKIVTSTGTATPYLIEFQGSDLRYRVVVDSIGAVQIVEVFSG